MSLITGDCTEEVLPGMDDWEWEVDGKQSEWLASLS